MSAECGKIIFRQSSEFLSEVNREILEGQMYVVVKLLRQRDIVSVDIVSELALVENESFERLCPQRRL